MVDEKDVGLSLWFEAVLVLVVTVAWVAPWAVGLVFLFIYASDDLGAICGL